MLSAAAIESLLQHLVRWAHLTFALVWLGQLAFVELIDVHFQRSLERELRPRVTPKLLLRVLDWQRWGALGAFVCGWALFVYVYGHHRLLLDAQGHLTGRAVWMLSSSGLGTLMWIDLWFVVWPRQRLLLGGQVNGTPVDDAERLQAVCAVGSRAALIASGPVLFGMLAASHLPAIDPLTAGVGAAAGLVFWMIALRRAARVKGTL